MKKLKAPMLALLMLLSVDTFAMDNKQLAFQLTTLFRSSRSIVTKNKPFIGNPRESLKGESPDDFIISFLIQTKKIYKKTTGSRFPPTDDTPEGVLRGHLIDSIVSVIIKAVKGQYEGVFKYSPATHFKKGVNVYDNKFLPARYAVEVMKEFNARTEGKALLKLTAPDKLLVKRSNAPDEWEKKILNSIFSKAGYERGSPFSEVTTYKGQKAFRQLLPEYYKKGCIGCHGAEAGQNGPNIHQSGKGYPLKTLGGGISIIILMDG
ncbi:hypothetical protein A9Q84_16520 [Halobacteriovorax marinus]|uniref:Cytochrome c domain-containing protein n=1 Tax=Halobacteriovorax marinus TaxID=97084 RepID=A0A1Y5F4F6_9BACT|nr:hypothetical protein A9Q84_16520 [Halobacteriovorax marinus]